VYEISREPVNGFTPKFTKTCVFGPCSDEFEGHGQRSKVKVTRDKNVIFGHFGGLRAFMFGKTSLAPISVNFRAVQTSTKSDSNFVQLPLQTYLYSATAAAVVQSRARDYSLFSVLFRATLCATKSLM